MKQKMLREDRTAAEQKMSPQAEKPASRLLWHAQEAVPGRYI